jgi:hypothetical protein
MARSSSDLFGVNRRQPGRTRPDARSHGLSGPGSVRVRLLALPYLAAVQQLSAASYEKDHADHGRDHDQATQTKGGHVPRSKSTHVGEDTDIVSRPTAQPLLIGSLDPRPPTHPPDLGRDELLAATSFRRRPRLSTAARTRRHPVGHPTVVSSPSSAKTTVSCLPSSRVSVRVPTYWK